MPKDKKKRTLELWSLKHLSLRLKIAEDELTAVAENPERFYHPFQTKKSDGTFRQLTDVLPRLKIIQKAIHRLLNVIDLGSAAHGGITGKSNLTNASVHCGKRYLFKLDFESYFPSISNHRVFHLFHHELRCSEDVAQLLTKLCTVNGCVPQGSSTSMDIANLVCRELDVRIKGVAESFDIVYSRYVDDLSFTGKYIPQRFINKIKTIVESKKWLSLNNKKEVLSGPNQEQTVTGLNVKYKKPRITRSYKRAVRAGKHRLLNSTAMGFENDNLKKAASAIKGKENYIAHVDDEKII